MKIKVFLCSALFLFTTIQPAVSAQISQCQLPSAKSGILSLGFPLSAERLASQKNPKVLVLPYYFKGDEKFILSTQDKEVFTETAKNITNLSKGISKVSFLFNSPIELDISAQELDQLKINASGTYMKDFENSTWGLVSRTIKSADSSINYSGIDGVILYGFGKSAYGGIAEAMTFDSDPERFRVNPLKSDGSSWFAPISTGEKGIANVVLLFNFKNSLTATHELLHLYGLPDLYGSAEGPGRLSVMDGLTMELLTYEKWLLGWHSNNQVLCESSEPVDSVVKFELNYKDSNHLALIRTSDRSVLVVETASGKYLSFYRFGLDKRPPLTFYTRDARGVAGLDFSDNSSVGKIVKGDTLSMLVSNKTNSSLTVYVFPNAILESPQVASLVAATNNSLELQLKQEAEAQADPQLPPVESKTAMVPAGRKLTISCVKGKATKKVTAVNPKCPAGYKKK